MSFPVNRDSNRPFKPIIYFGVCVDNKDPLGAGRIRAVNDVTADAEGGKLYGDAVEKVIEKDKKSISKKIYTPWGDKDPYIFNPFLPLHLNVIPNRGEAIKILYYNPENNQQNKEYIGPLTSTPDKLGGDEYHLGREHTSMGGRVKGEASVMDNADSIGVFPNADDIAIQGRVNTDIVLGMSAKLPQPQNNPQPETIADESEIAIKPYPQILLRSAKFKENLDVPSQPGFNDKMTFFQLSTFPSTLTIEEKEVPTQTKEDSPLSILIEYDYEMTDWANWQNSPGAPIDVSFKVYKMPYKATPEGTGKPYMSSNFTKDSQVGGLELIYEFNTLTAVPPTKEQCKEIINIQLRNFDTSNWTEFLKPLDSLLPSFPTGIQYTFNFNPVDDVGLGQKMQNNPHPLYYRPGPNFAGFIEGAQSDLYNTNPILYEQINTNVLSFINSIKLEGVTSEGGGLAFTEKITQREVRTKDGKKIEKEEKYDENQQQGFIVGGAEKIFLFSHEDAAINGKILLGDNYGIDQVKLITDVEKKTSPMVRGDKLLELLDYMKQYMVSHVHTQNLNTACPMCDDGVTSNEGLIEKMEAAEQLVLNKNIRIN